MGNHSCNRSDLRFVGQPSRLLAPIFATSDGGFVIATDRKTPTAANEYENIPTLYRLDSNGAAVWKAELPSRTQRFATYETTGAIVANDGTIRVRILSYPTPKSSGMQRFVKLSAGGAMLWDVQLPGRGGTDTPFSIAEGVEPNGDLILHGYIVLAREVVKPNDWTGILRYWDGVMTDDGRLGRPTTGATAPADEKFRPWPPMDPFWNDAS